MDSKPVIWLNLPPKNRDFSLLDDTPTEQYRLMNPEMYPCRKAYILGAGSGLLTFVGGILAHSGGAPSNVSVPLLAIGGSLLIGTLVGGISYVCCCVPDTAAAEQV